MIQLGDDCLMIQVDSLYDTGERMIQNTEGRKLEVQEEAIVARCPLFCTDLI